MDAVEVTYIAVEILANVYQYSLSSQVFSSMTDSVHRDDKTD